MDLIALQRDPDQLSRLLFGGWSHAAKRRYGGRFDAVKKALEQAFREYRPKGQFAWVMVIGTAKSHESYADPVALRDYLRDWLSTYGDDRPGKHLHWLETHPVSEPIDRAECHKLLDMAKGASHFYSEKAERKAATEDELEALYGLAMALQAFLDQSCQHTRLKELDGYSLCSSCGVVRVA